MKEKIKSNYLKIQREIEASSKGSSKPKIIAVTKSVNLPEMEALIELGLVNLAENRIEIAEEKKIALPSKTIVWHFIGNIQSRKIKRILNFADIIHSVDSLSLAQKINIETASTNKIQKILLQINIAEEKQKSGFLKTELLQAKEELKKLKNIDIIGFMTMAPLSSDENLIRTTFKDLKDFSAETIDLFSTQTPELSMGMTNDFKIATEEGATMLRIGSAFFEERT